MDGWMDGWMDGKQLDQSEWVGKCSTKHVYRLLYRNTAVQSLSHQLISNPQLHLRDHLP